MVTARDISLRIAKEVDQLDTYLKNRTEELEGLREQRRALTTRINTIEGYVRQARQRRTYLANEPPTGLKRPSHDSEWIYTQDLAVVIQEWLDASVNHTAYELCATARVNRRRLRAIMNPKDARHSVFTSFRLAEDILMAMDREHLLTNGELKVWPLQQRLIYDKLLREKRNGRRYDTDTGSGRTA